jgi:hypothetical protein
MPRDEQTDQGGVADRPLVVRKMTVPRPDAGDGWPMEGGRKTGGEADDETRPLRSASPGEPVTHREVWVLARRGDRDHAVFYLQSARLGDYEPAGLSPPDLGNWLREAPAEGVLLLAVDPNHLAQQRGEPQPALTLEGLGPDDADALYREIRAVEQQPAV